MDTPGFAPITLRAAGPADAGPLRRLAALDSACVPAPPLLLAEVDGVLRAALSLADGRAIADPFQRTAGLIALLRAQVAAQAEVRPRRPAVRRAARRPRLRPAHS
ncbi:MAG TPA: hypothetical protein VFN55_08595 [Solirubrobacteraceae bacterium]|nr:hypothetical protein [Solirubrobacteraceae bacterium]